MLKSLMPGQLVRRFRCVLLWAIGMSGAMAQAASISGTLTQPDGVTPIPSIFVGVYSWNGSWWSGYTASDYTDANGYYEVTGLPAGEHRISFVDWNGGYIGEFYNNKPGVYEADSFVVGASDAISGVDASLEFASRINGRVTGPDGLTPLSGISVQAYRWSGFWWSYVSGAYDSSDSQGYYSLARIIHESCGCALFLGRAA